VKLKRATVGVSLLSLLVMLSLLIMPGVVSASPDTDVFIEDALDVPVGDEATVNLDIDTDEAIGIGAATILLEYDPDVVNVNDVLAGDLGLPTAAIDNVGGQTTMTVAYGAEPCPTGMVKFADVVLEAVGDPGDTCDLEITVVSLFDCDVGAIVPDAVIDGTFEIAEELPPPPGTFVRDLGEGLNIVSTPVQLDEDFDTVAEIIPVGYNGGFRWSGSAWVDIAGWVWKPLEAFYVDVDAGATATFVATTDTLAPITRTLLIPNKWYLVGSSPLWDGGFADQTMDVVLAGLDTNFTNVVKPPLNQAGGSCTWMNADTLVLPPFEGVWVLTGSGLNKTIAGFCTTPLGPVVP
jgi:hypothetical protein